MTHSLARGFSGAGRGTLAFATAIGLAAFVTCLIPRASVPFLPLAMAAILLGSTTGRAGTRVLADAGRHLAAPAVVAFVVYLLVNASLALDPAAGIAKASVVVLLLAVWTVAARGLQELPEQTVSAGAAAFLIGCVAGAALLTFEVLSDQALTRLLYNVFPGLRPESTKHLGLAVGRVLMIGPYKLNRNLTLLVLMLWPALAILSSLVGPRWRRRLGVALLAVVTLAVVPSEHETSKIALAGSSTVFLLSRVSSRAVLRGLAVLWCLAFALVIPVTWAAYNTAELHKAEWLPVTARARIIMWGYTAEQIPAAPILGIGIRATRVLDRRQLARVEQPEDHVVPPRPGRHAHNLYLQTWFELGAIGVAFLVALGLAVLRRIARMPEAIRPFANALFAAFALLAAFSFGMWQAWLLAGYGLAALYLLLAGRYLTDRAGTG